MTTLDMSLSVSHNGIAKALELLHVVLSSPRFDVKSFERAKKNHVLGRAQFEKEIESVTFDNLMKIWTNSTDERLINPTKKSFESLTLEQVKHETMLQLQPHNIEICIVGDFDIEQTEELLLTYCGTITSPLKEQPNKPILMPSVRPIVAADTSQSIEASIDDDEERAHMCIGFTTVNRFHQLDASKCTKELHRHPLFCSRAMYLASMVILL